MTSHGHCLLSSDDRTSPLNQETAERHLDEASRLAENLKSVQKEMLEANKAAAESVGEERAAAEAKARALEDR